MQVAEKLMFMREECLEGNFDSIKTLRESNVPTVSYNRQSGSNDHDDSDDDDDDDDDEDDDDKDDNNLVKENSMEMDVDDDPQLQSNHTQKGTVNPEPSVPKLDDGWTVVASKRNRVTTFSHCSKPFTNFAPRNSTKNFATASKSNAASYTVVALTTSAKTLLLSLFASMPTPTTHPSPPPPPPYQAPTKNEFAPGSGGFRWNHLLDLGTLNEIPITWKNF
ncbi:Unknown protein [Striga hermonthica]|uniref:Uncharacterized protein n=1 Tax=Striga hermonthica TaxID=68872 RepID=A0A9N7NVZ4_STRHE|nr:Unknown protein [Striga hermonthica]